MDGRLMRGKSWQQPKVITKAGICCLFLFTFNFSLFADLGPSTVVLLVNSQSPTSKYIARLYKKYYPQITDSQILYLCGLPDCSGPSGTPASEIITRQQYDTYIAQPLRAYLSDANYPQRMQNVRVIITTAGMPYRIKDTAYSDAVYSAGSNPNTVISRESSIDAASVESELTCLWYCDNGTGTFSKINRMVNPYQAYRDSPISDFPKALPGTKTFQWNYAISAIAPIIENPFMEGKLLPPEPPKPPTWQPKKYYGTVNRVFGPGDIYLTCRLDGPKRQGSSAVFAVRAMLERAKRASSPSIGVNPYQAVAVLDDAPTVSDNYDNNRVFNLNVGENYWLCGSSFWDYDSILSEPFDAPQCRVKEDYIQAYSQITGIDPDSTLNIGYRSVYGGPICIMLDRRNNARTTQQTLDDYALQNPTRNPNQEIIFLASFGKNGDEANPSNYLYVGGPNNTNLFKCTNGAVFTSIESFNAVTMFSDVSTSCVAQGKIVDFIDIGGSGAIGHTFEPQPDAAVDNEFLCYNYLVDSDMDAKADLTFVEAAWTAIPYLSWSEVVIGDPLMRIAYGPGQKAWKYLPGDVNNDGRVNSIDLWQIKIRIGGALNTANVQLFELYDDLCDVNKDGVINYTDVTLAKNNMGIVADL